MADTATLSPAVRQVADLLARVYLRDLQGGVRDQEHAKDVTPPRRPARGRPATGGRDLPEAV